MKTRADSYQSFWPRYLAEHRSPGNRRLHFLGTGLAIVFLACTAILADLRFITAAVVAGYGFAWSGHAFVERNRPASLSHPYWSLYSDFRMFGLWLTGRLDAELRRHGLE
jgi:hypothetical protein